MDVTIVVPTHNRRPLLSAAIDAILQQRDVSFEVVVVNDGSSDDTKPWLERLQAQDSRIRTVHHERARRMSAARNAGIMRAAARWVAFCDDDDLWAPDKLARQLEALRESSARWGCTGAVLVDERLDIVGHHYVKGGRVLAELLTANVVPSGGSSVIAETALLKELCGFDEALQTSEDWDLWIRLAKHSPLAAVERPLIAYRQATGFTSYAKSHQTVDAERMRRGYRMVLSRHRAMAEELGAKPSDAAYERFLAKQFLRTGAGIKAAGIFARLALNHRRWQELPRVLAALAAPRLTDRIGNARAARAVPADWRLQAEAWLAPLRQAENSQPLSARASYPACSAQAAKADSSECCASPS